MRVVRLANPLVRVVLRSRLHPLLSGRLLLLAYRGRRTGRLHEIPVLYVEDGGRLVVVAVRPPRKLWWRSLTSPTPVRLVLRGTRLDASGVVLEGDERDAARLAYARGNARVERLTRDAAVVALTPSR